MSRGDATSYGYFGYFGWLAGHSILANCPTLVELHPEVNLISPTFPHADLMLSKI